jgi:precorrin-6B methylase 2
MLTNKCGKLTILGLAFVLIASFGLTSAQAQLQQLPAQKYINLMNKVNAKRDLKINQIIAKLGLKNGDILADIGSGSGTFTIPFAKAVAPKGTVYAVDIDPKMLDYVKQRAEKAGVTNVVTVLGSYTDPKLPVKDVDIAYFHRSLHMIEKREAYLDNTINYLKPTGRIVVIDKNPQDNPQNWMWLRKSDLDSWMAAEGFYDIHHFGLFDDMYFVVYQRPYSGSVLTKRMMEQMKKESQ